MVAFVPLRARLAVAVAGQAEQSGLPQLAKTMPDTVLQALVLVGE